MANTFPIFTTWFYKRKKIVGTGNIYCNIFNKYSLIAYTSTFLTLTLSWRRPLSYRNQSIDLQGKLMDWFLYDNGLHHERVKNWCAIPFLKIQKKNSRFVETLNCSPASSKDSRCKIANNYISTEQNFHINLQTHFHDSSNYEVLLTFTRLMEVLMAKFGQSGIRVEVQTTP